MAERKCCYKHCPHINNAITEEQIKYAHRNGTKFYHDECWSTKNDIDKAVDLIRHYLFPNSTFPSVVAAVNDAVFKRGNPSDYVVYAIKFEIEWGGRVLNGRTFYQIKNVFGLPYLLDNRIVKESYKKHIARAMGKDATFAIEGETKAPEKITTNNKKTEMEDFLGV